jgi:hypothetical protein
VLDTGASLLLQPVNSNRLQRRSFTPRRKEGRKGAKRIVSLRLCVKTASDFLVMVILDCGAFVWFLGQRLTGDAILAFNPLAQVDKLAPFRTEGTKRIIFPLD